jgi:hypothetical protein
VEICWKNFSKVLDFILSPCFECRMFCFWLFSGVWSLITNVSEHSVCPIFIGEWVLRTHSPERWKLISIRRRTTQKKTYDIFQSCPHHTKKLSNPGLLHVTTNIVPSAQKQRQKIYKLWGQLRAILVTERTAIYRNKRNIDNAGEVCTEEEIQWKKNAN